ncbi:MAG TPA: SLBB domain-containing protein [Pyrinomonadaceae bacterium]|jgi:polysaccharide export outer membrane protein|nr:SLBB domain-containing protein [Pyrinomonadaceae bacterium]
MKVLKALLVAATLCSTLALPLGAQEKAAPAKAAQPKKQQQQGAAPAASPSPELPQPAQIALNEAMTYTEKREYLLGPSDVVELRVFNDAQFNGELEVDADGNITVPFVDQPVRAQCRTVAALRKDVSSAIAKFLKEPKVYMRIKEQNSRKPAFIYGAVRTPAKYDFRRPVRLLELLSNSGGVTEQHSGTIQIMHTEPPLCPELEPSAPAAAAVVSEEDPLGIPFTLYKVAEIKTGKPEFNPYVRPGDIIYVAEASPVYVVGNVAQPANLYLREGTTLTRVLAQVGGAREANEEKIRIYRKKPDAAQEVITVNFKAIKQGKEPDPVLQAYDIVEVPKRGVFSPGGIAKIITGIGLNGMNTLGTAPLTRIIY